MTEHLPKQSGIYVATFAAIKNESGDLLLLKRGDMDKWCMPGGLVEIGESLTDGLKRECFEEIGVHINICEFQGFYTNPEKHLFILKDQRQLHYFAFVFSCTILSEHDHKFILDEKEVREAGYFSMDTLPTLVPSHTVWIHDAFLKEKGNVFMK